MEKIGLSALIKIGLGGLTVVGTLLGGCGSGSGTISSPSSPVTSNATRDAPTQLFGMWRLQRTSGGITGNGYPITPTTETLTFNDNGTYFRTINEQSTRGTYAVMIR